MPKIVVVEDDSSMSQAIERILRIGGFAAVMFASAEAAVDAAIKADCLILDIYLPGISGFEFYRHLALVGEKAAVIFITAHDEPSAREEAENLGASSFLAKPFSGRTLLEAVAQAVGLN
jgi:FixJ family two-component response regulator